MQSVPEIPLLSPSEFRIYALLESQGPLTIRDIGQTLARQDPNFSQGYNSLGTLLQRMIKKGYVKQEEQHGTAGKLYRSLFPYDHVVEQQTQNFLDAFHLTSQSDLQLVIEFLRTRLESEPA